MNWHIQIGDHKLEPMSGMIYWFTYVGIEFDIRSLRRVLGMKPETKLDGTMNVCRSVQEKIALFKSFENEPERFMSLVKQSVELDEKEAIEAIRSIPDSVLMKHAPVMFRSDHEKA